MGSRDERRVRGGLALDGVVSLGRVSHEVGPKVLVVDDDDAWRRSASLLLSEWGAAVQSASSVDEALALLDQEPFDVLLLDVHLGPGAESGLTVAQHVAGMAAAPATIVLSGAAVRTESFELARLGARAFLEKPVSADDLFNALRLALEVPADPTPFLQSMVGHVSLKDALRETRKVLVRQALGKANGNRTTAARILSVTRQGLQQILRDSD